MTLTATPDLNPRLLMRRSEAAECLAMSLDSFERQVQPHLKVVRQGHMVRVPVSEVRRWVRHEMEAS